MKKTITLLMVLFAFMAVFAQDELIRNGDFSQGVDGSDKIKDISFWNMDMETPGSGWWSQHVGMVSSDTSLYQVVEVIAEDSVLYTCTFYAENTWQTAKVIVTASITESDSTIRTPYKTKAFNFDEEQEFVFGFSQNSSHAGKKLVIEFDILAHDTAVAKGETSWCNLDNISMKKIIAGVNSAPVAVTGPPQTVKGGTEVTLDGTGSYDFEGSGLTYTWVSVYPGIFFNDNHSATPTFTAPDVSEFTTFEFTLKVNDGELNSEIVITSVTVSPAGEMIRNSAFELFTPGSDPSSTSLKAIESWNIDETEDNLNGGRWGVAGSRFATLASADPTLYQVIGDIGVGEEAYLLRFSARSSWNSQAIQSIFSISEGDSSVRTQIDVKNAAFAINPDGGVNTTAWQVFTHALEIPANSAHAGKILIVEFDNLPYDDGTDNGWAELDNISLLKTVTQNSPNINMTGILVYPNPASDRIYIKSPFTVTRIGIYSVLGTEERSWINPVSGWIELAGLPKGIHFITIKTSMGVITRKLTIK